MTGNVVVSEVHAVVYVALSKVEKRVLWEFVGTREGVTL
jgi:hypothetical protein